MKLDQVDEFVASVRRCLNQHQWWTVAVRSLAVGVTVMVIVGLTYIIRGHAVPWVWYPVTGLLTVLGAVTVWYLRSATTEDASAEADRFFQLKDTVTSCRHFAAQGRRGGFFDLQAAQTHGRIDGLDAANIPYHLPRRTLVFTLVLSVIAIMMGFKSPSQAVQDKLALEIATTKQTSKLNKELEELIDKLEEEVKDEEERKLVEPNKLRQWVNELKETTDQKKALRQYAKLEQKLNLAASRLEQKKDEQFLQRAAKELTKSPETDRLGKTLQQKKYDDAAKQLREQKPRPETKKPLSKQRKELSRLMATAKRMSAAARNADRNRNRSASKPSDGQPLAKKPAHSAGKPSSTSISKGQTGAPSDMSDAQSVEQIVQDLDQALEDLDEALADAELQEAQGEQAQLGECHACQIEVGEQLDELVKKLAKLGLKRRAQAKLAKLCKACGQCQSECAGLAQSPNAGGKEAGWGASDSRRDERDKPIDNGQYTQLKGIKGQGPSVTSVEAAEDGSGVATAADAEQQRTFQRQLESFVQREDVPEDVKSGVKRYFENIHQTPE